MPYYVAPSGVTTPFGRNEPLRSTKNLLKESYTFAASTLPAVTIDGQPRKILQPGAILCKITAVGADQGKVGVFQTGATDGRQTIANFVGVNDSFWPYQLEDGDIEVAAVYGGVYIFTKCMQQAAGTGAMEALSTANRDAIVALAPYGKLLVFAD